MQNNIRKVRFNKLVDRSNDLNVSAPCYAWQEGCPNEGIFHEWFHGHDELPFAMIELANGMMILIPCDQIRFVEHPIADKMTITLNPVLKSKKSGNGNNEMYGEAWQKEMFKKQYSDIVDMAKKLTIESQRKWKLLTI